MKANQKKPLLDTSEWIPMGICWSGARTAARYCPKGEAKRPEGKQGRQSAPEFDIQIASIGCVTLLPDGRTAALSIK